MVYATIRLILCAYCIVPYYFKLLSMNTRRNTSLGELCKEIN